MAETQRGVDCKERLGAFESDYKNSKPLFDDVVILFVVGMVNICI